MTLTLGVMPESQAAAPAERIRNVVLVHGAFVDGGGWEQVYRLLSDKGYKVSVVQHPTLSLAADVAATKAVLDAQDGPVVLVGHSYGGVVVTEAGNDPKVARLVYIAAFMPDKGESVQKLIGEPSPGAPPPAILPPVNGFLWIDKARFASAFCADLPAPRAQFLANAQVPWGVAAFAGEVTTAAWRDKPSWSLVAQEDHMIPPDAQRGMSKRAGAVVVEARGSHAIFESKPAAVVALIERAAMNRP
ncbi:MAG TPA: alpha/beta hydrolase [Ideonella sp.]|uniref:alpha/beta hydrolase n=1 Tax=Ideonella sp. TaxID=1929293 RepID=UPI002D049224|nr:alpha/beta hydrolase [Ideonella sp.]HSI49431.1 alpha/beta hydrolase [Ideonella sp.]